MTARLHAALVTVEQVLVVIANHEDTLLANACNICNHLGRSTIACLMVASGHVHNVCIRDLVDQFVDTLPKNVVAAY